MRGLLAGFIALHGLVHLLGAAKAFGVLDLPQLTQPISRGWGVLWLIASLALLITAGSLATSSRQWWIIAGVAVLLSQVVIASSWHDARFGTLANILIVAFALYGVAHTGPWSFRSRYTQESETRLAALPVSEIVTEEDLHPLPAPLQRYLRRVGVVGKPHVQSFSARWKGRIRSGPEEPWMELVAEQINFVKEPARFFRMDAKRGPIPIDVFHSFAAGAASMEVRILSMVPIVKAAGADLTQAETVTLFNDLCVLAPGALLDPSIRWDSIDETTVIGHYTVGGNTVSARLTFNAADELTNFVSDDRLASSPDGTSFEPMRWSTPLRDYRSFGDYRVSSHGEGVWHAASGEYSYIELDLMELRVHP